MGYHETKWLIEYNHNTAIFFFREVDNILAAFDKEHKSINFMNFLNINHLKFTIKKQVKYSITFLDVLVSGTVNQMSNFKCIANRPTLYVS